MTHSALAAYTDWTSDCSSRDGAAVRYFIVHHAATTSLGAILALFRPGGRTVSANYAIGNDGTIVATVPREKRAWTTGSYLYDKQAITVEVANSQAGGKWPVSQSAFDALARLIADEATAHGFPIDDAHVITHQEVYARSGGRESYATACPGDLQNRKAELIALARSYQGSGPAPAPKPPEPIQYPARELYGSHFVSLLQQDIIKLGHNLAPWGADSMDGAVTQRAVRAVQSGAHADGFRLAVDGIGGPETRAYVDWKLLQLGKAPSFPLPDGWYFGWRSGPTESVSGFHGYGYDLLRVQTILQVRGWYIDPDGLYAGETNFIVREFQDEKGLKVDGLLGPATWRSIWESPWTPPRAA